MEKSKEKISIEIIKSIILFFPLVFLSKYALGTSWSLSIFLGVIITFSMYLLERLVLLITKEEKEKGCELRRLEKEGLKLEGERINKLTTNELIKESNKLEKRYELYKENLNKRKDYYGESNFGLRFAEFGIIVFFVGILFIGSLNGIYFDREVYVDIINITMEKGTQIFNYASEIIFDSFKFLFIKFYDIGSENPKKTFYLWVVTIIWWIGYMFVYQVFKESYLFIKLVYSYVKQRIKTKNERRKKEK